MSLQVLLRFIGFAICASAILIVGCVSRDCARCGDLPEPPPFSDTGDVVAPDRWWLAFEDAALDFYINQSFEGSYGLEAALQRVCAARAIARREASDLRIDLDGVSSVNSAFGPGPDTSIYRWGFDVSYQIDLWGEIESRVAAQRIRARAACDNYHAVALTLTADIATTWFSLIEAQAQIELLQQQIETNRTGLELQESRFGLGLIRSADVLRQRQLLESTLEQAVVAESRFKLLEHQLAVLLGEPPQFATYEPGSILPQLPPLPSTGLPAELVTRRPDVRRDYLACCAADRDLASAVSAQYPRLNFNTSISNIAEDPSDLFRDWFVSIGSQLIAPLLDGGQRRAEVARNCAVKRELFNLYAQTVLNAFREVEDNLVQEKYQLQRIKHLEEQVRLAGQASDQLRDQYLIGDVEYLDVLSAITGQQSLQRQLLSAQLELRLIRISLYLSLAGGFDPQCQVTEDVSDTESIPIEQQEAPPEQDTTEEDQIIEENNE